MKKKILLPLIMALTTLGCITACSNSSTNDSTVEITDMVGLTVTIKKNPKKVACISRTTYDLLVAYGLGDHIDGAYKGTLNNAWVPLIYPESKNHYVYESMEFMPKLIGSFTSFSRESPIEIQSSLG